MGNAAFELRDRVRVLERENASLIRQLTYAESEWTRLRHAYEPLPEHAPEEVSHARVIETETAQRQRSAAALASGDGDDAEYLELARQAAWDAVSGDKLYFSEPVEIGGMIAGEKYPSGWPDALPKHVVCNRYVQLDDTGTCLADWGDVAGGHQIGHPGKPIGVGTPPVNDKRKAPSTWLSALAEKRGLKLVE
jgi:hypothetical protein